METYDITIVGAGPAGLMLACHLSRWGYKIKHIDKRPEVTATGRADGIQPRSMDLFKNLGLKRQLMAFGPARVYEVAFWSTGEASQGIVRTDTSPSCPRFIDTRHPYTTLLHQGFIERILIADIEASGNRIDRPWTITGFRKTEDASYPLEVHLEHVKLKRVQVFRTKYLFGGEGSKSFIRCQLGIQLQYKDPIQHLWGVMDGVVRTNFPDIKMKCTIRSGSGSIMIIPRENNLVRLYIQLASATDADWSPRKQVSAEHVQEVAKGILRPYWIEWDWLEWYSVYPIGQGIAERYTLDERIFLGGDACHTHSPKAGQGMNTAFLDAQNLAWKIHHVESGFAKRAILKTYELERRQIAETLLDFDAKYAKLFSEGKPSVAPHAEANGRHTTASDTVTDFLQTFKANCEFTSGYGVFYGPNELNWSPHHPAQGHLLNPRGIILQPGRIFPTINVIRVEDANEVHLEEEIPVNGSYRIYLFAGNLGTTNRALVDFAKYVNGPDSFYTRHQHENASCVSYHERHNPHSDLFTICIILASERSKIDIASLPEVLRHYASHVYADHDIDARSSAATAPAHAKLGIDVQKGAVVVVRPDAYVACVVGLAEGDQTVESLDQFFAASQQIANPGRSH